MGASTLVVKLWSDPNAMATTVLTKHMTLNIMLKSGVGSWTKRGSAYTRRRCEVLKGKRKSIV